MIGSPWGLKVWDGWPRGRSDRQVGALPTPAHLASMPRPCPLGSCSEDAKRLCKNPTLVGESRDQVGCRT